MNPVRLVSRVPVLLAVALIGAQAQTQITSPEKFFGFQLGSDRKMARWDKMIEYYNLLEKESGEVAAAAPRPPNTEPALALTGSPR